MQRASDTIRHRRLFAFCELTASYDFAGGAPAPVVTLPAVSADEVEVEQFTSMRRTIARRLTEAWQAPVFQLGITADMGRALELRKRLVELHADGVKPTISDLLTKICAAALVRHRAVNALYQGDAVELHASANIGIAVDSNAS